MNVPKTTDYPDMPKNKNPNPSYRPPNLCDSNHRREAHWIDIDCPELLETMHICSECDWYTRTELGDKISFKYCPMCGSHMSEKTEREETHIVSRNGFKE